MANRRRRNNDRLDIVQAIRRFGRPVTASELADKLKRERATVSRALNAMAASKVLAKQRQGMSVYYEYLGKDVPAHDIEVKNISPQALVEAAKYILSQDPWTPKMSRFFPVVPLAIADLLQNGKASPQVAKTLQEYRESALRTVSDIDSYLSYSRSEAIDYDTQVLVEQLIERFTLDLE